MAFGGAFAKVEYLYNVNYITLIIISIAVMPVVAGFLGSFSKDKLQDSLASLLDNVEFIVSLFLSIYITKKLFFDNSSSEIFSYIYSWIPQNIKQFLFGRDVLTYLIAVPFFMLIITLLLRLITDPLYRFAAVPVANGIYSILNSSGSFVKRMVGAVWQIPKALFLVFIFGLVLNFYTYYFPAPALSKLMNESKAYQLLYKGAICPALNSNIAKRFPVILNYSFSEIGKVLPGYNRNGTADVREKLKAQLEKRNIKIIEYFNGVTLDEAIKTNPEIEETARKVAGSEESSKKKAELLYDWISQNIEYDYEKAERLGIDPKGISSGAIEAFTTRKGVCFDYSCLYISMCRTNGLKVRLVTGLGYSGVSWGDHAWNQVYIPEESRWVDVDATFGSIANYFDKADFEVDHRYEEIQGEW